jgi:glutamyl/glutaminyl-tRNA synthetase
LAKINKTSDDELYSLEEIEKIFDYQDMGISGAVFNRDKLDYMNGYYIRQKPLDELVELCAPFLANNIKMTQDPRRQTTEFLKKVVSLEQERIKRLSDIGELTEFFFMDKLEYDMELLIWKKMSQGDVKNNLEKLVNLLEKIPEKNWTNDSIEEAILSYLEAKNLKVGEWLWPMRVSLTGRKASPGPFEVAEALGKAASLERIKDAILKL